MPQAQQALQTRRVDLPIADRQMELRSFKRRDAAAEGEATQAPLATAELVFTTGAPVLRYDWSNGRYYQEELVVDDASIRLDRLAAGAPLLNTHDSWDLEAVLGVVDQPAVAAGMGTCRVAFSRRDSVAGYVQDVADGIVRNVSVGYVRHRMEMIAPDDLAGVWRYRVTDWEPMEVSLVPIPADPGAQVRGAGGEQPQQPQHARSFPCECIEIRAAGAPQTPAVGASADPLNPGERSMPTPEELAAAEAKRQADEKLARDAAVKAETARSTAITELCTRHSTPALATKLIADGKTVDEARAAVLEEIAVRDAAAGGHRNVRGITTERDEVETRMQGIGEALLSRVDVKATLTDNGRQYRGMSLLEIGREHLERSGVNTRGMHRLELAGAMLQHRSGGRLSTSDFASLLQNVATKRLRQSYEENMPSYQRWARRAPDAPDFKSMSVVNLAGAPDLLQTNEHGEFKYGAMTDGKETYSLVTYGRIVALTRQAVINDDLRGFDRLVGAFGNSAARLENRTAYAILTANANLSDGGALFNATAATTAGGHANLTSSGTVISVASLAVGRAAMRRQKGLQSEELNLTPAYLIVPATQEALAYQYTSSQFVPATSGAVNEFRQGGRTALEPIVEAILDGNSTTAWYLAANNGQVDTVEYCYLDGAAGPVIESDVAFEVDGISYKCREDFAAKAIDFRGLYKNVGA